MSLTTLLVQALLVTSSIAFPSSRQPFGRDLVTQHSYDGNWAGAVNSAPAGTWTSVTATLTLPDPRVPASGESGTYAASAWVGIDGDTCKNATVHTSITLTVDASGANHSYTAWYEWLPDTVSPRNFSGISFKSGDSVTLTATVASGATSGTVVIQNNSNDQCISEDLKSFSALCQQDAEWIVEDFLQGKSLVPFADFGTVEFTGALASSASGSVGPASEGVVDIEQNGRVLTRSSVGNSGVTVRYIGH